MKQKRFFSLLSIILLLTAILVYFGGKWPIITAYTDLSWISLALFTLLTIGIYYAAVSAVKSKNKNTFINAVMGFTMGKLFLSGIVLFAYYKIAGPPTKYFIGPFFAIYFIFTIFETYFLMKVGKMKA